MASTFATAAAAAAAALLFACDPYSPTDDLGPDAADDAPAPDGGVDDATPDTPPGPVTLTVTRDGSATGAVTSNPAGISCGPTCAATFDPGAVVTLSATPDAGAEFAGWSGGGCTGTDPCTITLAAATAVTATFEVPSFPLTVALGGNGTGAVSGGAIACPGTCRTDLAFGAQLTLTAAASAGSIFTGWSGACSGTGACTITVGGALDVTANFALDQTLIVATSGNGTGTVTSIPTGIACGADCDQTYPPGTMVTLTAAADGDSIFTGWSGGGCTGTGTCTVTVDAAVQVTATFVLKQFTLTVDPGGAGAGTVTSSPIGISCGADCNELYDVGAMVTLTAAPAIGSTFTGWSGGGCSGTGSCVVILAAATTVAADFAPIVHTLTVARVGSGAGTVSSSPSGLSCGADCSEDYAQGAIVTLTATPSAGSTFGGWTGGACTGTGACVVTMAAGATAIATFTIVQHPLTVATAGAGSGTVSSSPTGIACGADCAESYNAGTGVTLTAIPAAGSTFGGWSGGGCTGTGTCVVTVNAATMVTATFALSPYALTVAKAGTGGGAITSSPAGISCGADCSESYDFGTSVTLTAAPSTGSTFSGWSGGGCSGTGTCLVAIGAATSVTATFTAIQYALAVSKTGAGSGTIASSPAGVACGADCTETYDHGTIITLTATASAGSTFGGWSGGGCSGTGTCVVTLTAAASVSAAFTLDPFSLTVTKAGTGAGTIASSPPGIGCGADCSETYAGGTPVTLTATPATGSTFSGWSGAGCSGAGTCLVTISAATSVTATFTAIQYALAVSKTGAGTGTIASSPSGIACGADCTESYNHGTIVTLTATPSAGSTFGGWTGGGCSGTGSCVVTLTAAASVSAAFTLDPFSLTVIKAGTGAGSVSSSPAGIGCGADCTEAYANGTPVTLTATPAIGSTFTGWSGAGCSGAGTCLVTIASATSVTATFTAIQYALAVSKTGAGAGTIASSPAGIACGADCTETYDHGTIVTLTAAASAGSSFVGWTGGGCTGTGTCVVTLTAATSVSAAFALDTFSLAVSKTGAGAGTIASSPAGISCGADCAEPFAVGTIVTLTAAPSTGSTFTGWSGAGCSGTGTCVVTISAATSVTASFAVIDYLLTVAKAGTGAGTVTSSPTGIGCGADCTELVGHGTMITLTATPSAGSTFAGWSGGGCTGTGTCVVTVTAAATVTATFTLTTPTLTAGKAGTGAGTVTSSPAGISCGADCAEPFNYNTSVALTAAPSTGSTFAGWSGGGCSGTGTCVVAVTADTTVTATFTIIPYVLTAAKAGTGAGTVTSTPAGLSCGADCSESYGYNTSVTLSAAPSTGSTFTGWSGGGCSGTGTCIVAVTASTTVTASFTINPYDLSVSKSGTGSGTVSSAPLGIVCGADCSGTYDYNTSVTLSAVPHAGSTFSGWSGGGCSGTGTCVVLITAATSVTASFAINTYQLMVNRPGTGAGTVSSSPSGINCGADCSQTYTYNTSVTLSAVPSTGSTFTGWSGGGCSGTGTCVVAVTAGTTVSATFTLIPYPFSVAKSGTGAGTVTSTPSGISCGADCSESYNHGTSVTLAGVASAGSSFAGWSGGGCSGTGTCTVAVTAATTVTASFAGFPTGLVATAGPAKITLSWTAVPGATRYHVYAGQVSGTYTQQWYTTGATPSSVDDSAMTTHYFVVKAVHPSGESAASAEVSATGWANLSRGHATSQSSDWSATLGHAPLAVDGNHNGDFAQGSVTSTNWGANEWWQVDLGGSRTIKGLDLYNRTDCCANELHNILVFTSTDGISWTGRISYAPQIGSPSSFTLASVTGRYLRIQLQAPANALMLAEVDVWGN